MTLRAVCRKVGHMDKTEPAEGTTVRGALKLARQHMACLSSTLAREKDPRQHEVRAALALLDMAERRLERP